jgi:hypothetical protein
MASVPSYTPVRGECSCRSDDDDYGRCLAEDTCVECLIADGECECGCQCWQCLYTETPCGKVIEGICYFCDIRQEREQEWLREQEKEKEKAKDVSNSLNLSPIGITEDKE